MSDFAQTVSCDRLPQRIAARTERSSLTCSTSASSASVNFCWMLSGVGAGCGREFFLMLLIFADSNRRG